jgi:hypothetical protein
MDMHSPLGEKASGRLRDWPFQTEAIASVVFGCLLIAGFLSLEWLITLAIGWLTH